MVDQYKEFTEGKDPGIFILDPNGEGDESKRTKKFKKSVDKNKHTKRANPKDGDGAPGGNDEAASCG